MSEVGAFLWRSIRESEEHRFSLQFLNIVCLPTYLHVYYMEGHQADQAEAHDQGVAEAPEQSS
jgi:hypothetical protein